MKNGSLVGKSALVTGAGSGIGRQIAIDLAKQGARVVLAGRRITELEQTGRQIDPHGRDWLAIACNVTDESSVKSLMSQALADRHRLDIAVNSAGIFRMSHLDETEVDAFRAVIETNVIGTWLCMKHEISAMKGEGCGGAIVNIASNIGSHLTLRGTGAYAASKASIAALTRTAALEAVGLGVRINSVSPGPVDTSMSYRPGEDRATRDSRVAGVNPSKRVATLEEISSAVLWLCSDGATYTIGHDLVVDGGASL